MFQFSILIVLMCVLQWSSSFEILQLPTQKLNFGDLPHWDSKRESLFYTDQFATTSYTIFRYDFKTNRTYPAYIENEPAPSFFIPTKDCKNQFIAGLGQFVKIVRWDGKSVMAKVVRVLTEHKPDPAYPNVAIHTGKTDKRGNLYFGTFDSVYCRPDVPANGALYRYSTSNGLVKLLNNVKLTGGIAFNERAKKFYAIDTCKFTLDEFDWNPETGAICNGRTVFNFDASNGPPTSNPIGLTIDRIGNLWVAMYNASSVVQINPKNLEPLQTVTLPTEMIFNVAFGGPKKDILFVTTGITALKLDTAELTNQMLTESAGTVFMVKGLCVKGYAGRRARVCRK